MAPVVAGLSQAIEEDGVGHHEVEQVGLEPQALAVEDGEEGEPEEHRVEFALQKGERRGHESESGEGSAEEEV